MSDKSPAGKAAGFRPPIRREAGEEPPQRGIKALEEARGARTRLLRPSLKAAAWFGITLLVAMVFYIRWESGQVDKQRQELMARQRAADAELGVIWHPLRDKIESMVLEVGAAPTEDVVDLEALKKVDFRERPGIYLRLRQDQASTAPSIRDAAEGSLRDGFTACLMRTPGDNPIAGPECERSGQCAPGQLCNEFSRCARPGQPYNLRLAYKALRVLRPEWIRSVQDATTELRLRALTGTFEDANRIDFPVAVDILTKAEFFLVVIDERPSTAAEKDADAGVSPEDAEVLEGKTWPSRVALYRLSDKKLMFRIRRDVKGELMGGTPVADPEVAAARARQATSCALALEVRKIVGDPASPAGP